MAGQATTEDLIALQQKQHQELTGALDNITKNIKQLFKDVAGIVKDDGKSITDSIKKFESDQKKQREKNNQLRMTELQDLNKKIRGVEQDIRKARGGELETSLKLQQDYNKKIKQLELFEMGYKLQKNKEFYKEINKTFKEFSDRTTKVAGKLDSIFSTTFFGSIAKATNSIAGMKKNLLNFGLGTIKFLQTATSKERGGGLKMALAQTKIGRGVRDVKRSFRQTKIGIGKGIKAIKSNMGGASGRMSTRAKATELQETQVGIFKETNQNKKTTMGMFGEQNKFFKWFRNQWLLKMLWDAAKWAFLKGQAALGGLLNFLKGGRGAAGEKGVLRKTAQMGRIGLKKLFRTGAGKFLGGTKGGLPTKLLKSGLGIAGAIGGIKGLIKGIHEFGEISKKYGKGLEGGAMGVANVSKNLASGIISGFTFGLISTKSINKVIDSAGTLVNKITGVFEKPQKIVDMERALKAGLSKQAIQTGKSIESIMEKTGVKSTSSRVLKQIMEDKEKWNKLTKEEQELVSKRVEGAKRRQLQKDKTPQIYAAEGFPKKTAQPKKLGDLFGKIDTRTNVTVAESGEAEYLSVLKKGQYEQLRNIMGQNLMTLNPKSIGKGKKSEEEKRNQDEDIRQYGNVINKGTYKLKDQTIDIEKLPFKNRLMAMLAERFKLTGKQTQINSGYRSIEDQMRVYREMPDRAAKPGRSPHGPPNPRAVDMDSTDVADLVELGLIKKYGFKYPTARTKSGATETWHVQAKEGAAFANAPKDFMMKGHAGEGAFVAKTKEFESVFKYFEMGKQLAENVMSGKLGMNFSKDIPGRALRDTSKGVDAGENKLAQQAVKLLSEIKAGLAKDKMGKEETGKKAEKSMGSLPSASGQGGSAGYKPKSEVFPTDILMTNMYAMMTQFSGGY